MGDDSMNTKDAIKGQFMELYKQKAFERITVKELCAQTPVARTTFYAHFQNTDEVKGEIEDGLMAGLVNMPKMDLDEFLQAVQQYIKANWDGFYTFLICQPNHRFIEKWKDGIKLNFSRRYPEMEQRDDAELIGETIASAMIGLYTYWMKHPEKVDVDEMVAMLSKTEQILISCSGFHDKTLLK